MGRVLVLLQGCCLQHEVLLLGCIHLMQVLRRHALRSVDGMLDHLLHDMMEILSILQLNFGPLSEASFFNFLFLN